MLLIFGFFSDSIVHIFLNSLFAFLSWHKWNGLDDILKSIVSKIKSRNQKHCSGFLIPCFPNIYNYK
ncbi:hypothetical protein NC99_34420 [Sunxiuqinia dokdonensis]|uniref:Uncharacterized protein n=1 Tax=Sunxiuqinia dokdonensis TaxID=1409788 RepID=A0A0L8V6D6_9BACT|nr:hypothetical protein NC99_34420 [Sunxiuqinia dokdonensis]